MYCCAVLWSSLCAYVCTKEIVSASSAKIPAKNTQWGCTRTQTTCVCLLLHAHPLRREQEQPKRRVNQRICVDLPKETLAILLGRFHCWIRQRYPGCGDSLTSAGNHTAMLDGNRSVPPVAIPRYITPKTRKPASGSRHRSIPPIGTSTFSRVRAFSRPPNVQPLSENASNAFYVLVYIFFADPTATPLYCSLLSSSHLRALPQEHQR